jgi:hypothetical protein
MILIESGHCVGCQEPIFGRVTSYTQSEIKFNFHPNCFVCSNCSQSMDGKSFYQHENKYLDTECYYKVVLGFCSLCNQPFRDPTIIKASGKQYHPTCFTCSTCSNPLTSAYIEKEDKHYCKVQSFFFHILGIINQSLMLGTFQPKKTIHRIATKNNFYHRALHVNYQ